MNLAVIHYAFRAALSAWVKHLRFFIKLWFVATGVFLCWALSASVLASLSLPLSFYLIVPLTVVGMVFYIYYVYAVFIAAVLAIADQEKPFFLVKYPYKAVQLAVPHLIAFPVSAYLFTHYVGLGGTWFFWTMQLFTLFVQMMLCFYPYVCLSGSYTIWQAFRKSFFMMVRIPFITFVLAGCYMVAWLLTVASFFVAGFFFMPVVFLMGAFIFKQYPYERL